MTSIAGGGGIRCHVNVILLAILTVACVEGSRPSKTHDATVMAKPEQVLGTETSVWMHSKVHGTQHVQRVRAERRAMRVQTISGIQSLVEESRDHLNHTLWGGGVGGGLMWVASASGAGCCFEPEIGSNGSRNGIMQTHDNVTDDECEKTCRQNDVCVGVNIGPLTNDFKSACVALYGNWTKITTDCTKPLEHAFAHRCLVKFFQANQSFVTHNFEQDDLGFDDFVQAQQLVDDAARRMNMKWVNTYSPKALQRLTQNTENDERTLFACLVFNAVVLGFATCIFIVLRRNKPHVFCLRPNMLRLWHRNDSNADNQIMLTAGLDGLMFLKCLRLGMHLSLFVGVANILIIGPAHFLEGRYRTHNQIPIIHGTCPPGRGIYDAKECERAVLRLGRKETKWAFQPGHCTTRHMLGNIRGTLICRQIVFPNIANVLSIENVGILSADRPALWVYTTSVALTTAIVLLLLSRLMLEFADRRQAYLTSTPARCTVFVNKIPRHVRGSGLRDLFEKVWPESSVVHAFHVKRPPKNLLQGVAGALREQLHRASRERHHEGEKQQSQDSPAEHWEYTPCGFVTFKRVRDAHQNAQILLSHERHAWLVSLAPEPQELLWENIFLKARPCWMWCRKIIALILLSTLFFFWFIPVTLFSTMAMDNVLSGVWYFSDYLALFRVNYTMIFTAMNGNMSAAWMALFMSFLPMIFEGINYVYGYPAQRMINSAVQRQFLFFCIFYVLLVNAMTQSFLKFIEDIVQHPTHFLSMLGQALPQVSSWYMSYITFGLCGLSCELLRPWQMIVDFWQRRVTKGKPPSEQFFSRPPESFSTLSSRWSLYLSIALVWSTMDPIILLISLLVFSCALMVFKYLVLCVYRETYDTGGLWVPVATQNLLLVLGIYQMAMLGVLHQHMEEGFHVLLVNAIIIGIMCATYSFSAYVKLAYTYEFLPRTCSDEVSVNARPIGDYRYAARKAIFSWQAAAPPEENAGDIGGTAVEQDVGGADGEHMFAGFDDLDTDGESEGDGGRQG